MTILRAQEEPLQSQDSAQRTSKKPDVVFVPTPHEVVQKMLDMAEIKSGDVIYDLGCGDGRIVVAAAKRFGVKAYGFDIDPQRVQESLANVRSNRVEHLVTIRQADIFALDLTPADVVTLYLLPGLNERLMPQLARLSAGSRIISHDFDMGNAQPVAVDHVDTGQDEAEYPDYENYGNEQSKIYKWIVPWSVKPSALPSSTQ
jgi:SAM-dependent methyltransferase